MFMEVHLTKTRLGQTKYLQNRTDSPVKIRLKISLHVGQVNIFDLTKDNTKFVCIEAYCPSQQFFSHVGMEPTLPGFN